jgi:predicted flap endonuclease-1-like 5' DNA nuclease
MELIRDYWWLIVIALAILLALVLLRPRQRVQLTESAPQRAHMAYAKPPEGRGLAGEAASAASAVAGEIIGAPVRKALDGESDDADDLTRIKGIGPKFADVLRGAGITRFDQLAGLSETEVERLDGQLGAFGGRIRRDRIVEQADYLARNDIDGFEQRFGKL